MGVPNLLHRRNLVASVEMLDVITPYFIEEDSTLLVDNQEIAATEKNVYEALYGE